MTSSRIRSTKKVQHCWGGSSVEEHLPSIWVWFVRSLALPKKKEEGEGEEREKEEQHEKEEVKERQLGM